MVIFSGQQPLELQDGLTAIPLDYQALARARWRRKKLYLNSLATEENTVPYITLQRLTAKELEDVILLHFDTIVTFESQKGLLLPIVRKIQDDPTKPAESLLEFEELKLLRVMERKMLDLYESLLEAMIVEPQRYTHDEVVTIYNSLSREERDALNQLMQLQLASHAGQATIAQRRMAADQSQMKQLMADAGVPYDG